MAEGQASQWSSNVWQFPAVPTSIRQAREAAVSVSRDVGAGHQILDNIRLAVSEAATNVVLHAYPDQRDGQIHLTVFAGPNEVRVEVSDDGHGHSGVSAQAGLGVGISVMRAVSDECALETRPEGGSTVRLTFTF